MIKLFLDREPPAHLGQACSEKAGLVSRPGGIGLKNELRAFLLIEGGPFKPWSPCQGLEHALHEIVFGRIQRCPHHTSFALCLTRASTAVVRSHDGDDYCLPLLSKTIVLLLSVRRQALSVAKNVRL
jgi:hypothetical protein